MTCSNKTSAKCKEKHIICY